MKVDQEELSETESEAMENESSERRVIKVLYSRRERSIVMICSNALCALSYVER